MWEKCMIGYFLLFLSIDFLFSLSGIQFPPYCYHVSCAYRIRDEHKRSKRNTDSTDATDLFFHGSSFYCIG